VEDAEEHGGTHGLLAKWSKIKVNYRSKRWGFGNAAGRRTRTLNFNRIISLAGLYFAFPATLTTGQLSVSLPGQVLSYSGSLPLPGGDVPNIVARGFHTAGTAARPFAIQGSYEFRYRILLYDRHNHRYNPP
jgi:hypothetical protein